MINEIDRNTRTLIVCFVIAIMALIPLRFVEIGQSRPVEEYSVNQVLGESVEVEQVPVSTVGKLEAPYNEIEVINVAE